jgi:Holliday junction resolvase RusA-like endonuclease
MRESSRAVGPWREAVRSETQKILTSAQPAFSNPAIGRGLAIVAQIQVYLSRPAGHYGTGANTGKLKPSAPDYPTGRPDVDKLQRAILDGLKSGGAYHDDAQVVAVNAVKSFADDNTAPGCEIWLRPASKLARMTVTDPRAELRAQGVI